MARVIDGLVGHKTQVSRLWKAADDDRVASTFLFVGPEGVGKFKVAKAFAQRLICQEGTGCGFCGPCIRVEKQQSEAVKFIQPEKRMIKVDEAREIIKFISLQTNSKARVVIIDGAHLMNVQTANALLKSLEEPPNNVHFILISSGASSLLPTIRSRSQIVRFGALTTDEISLVSQEPEWVVRSSQGSLGFIESLKNSDMSELRGSALRVWEMILDRQKDLALGAVRDLVKDRGHSLQLARLWQQFVRDAWFLKENIDGLIHADFFSTLQKLSSYEKSQLEVWGAEAYQLEKDIEGNLDRSLAFESYLHRVSFSLGGVNA